MLALAFVMFGAAVSRAASTYATIFDYKPGTGTTPQTGLLPDGAGGFYGTTSADGGHGKGTAYHLTPPDSSHPSWTTTTLYEFEPNVLEGAGDLVLGHDGALYGTALFGGTNHCGCGALFRLAPPAAGQSGWTLSVLFNFDYAAGAYPVGGRLLVGKDGSLYSVASMGGPVNIPTCAATYCGTGGWRIG